ncbi:hypothetical protein [Thiocapsa sp.]|nr:hypothetical protein [Thiocapsa sp.]
MSYAFGVEIDHPFDAAVERVVADQVAAEAHAILERVVTALKA